MKNRTTPLLLTLLASCLLCLTCPADADIPAAAGSKPKPPSAVGTSPSVPDLFVRIVIDSIYCEKESKWDHGTSQDEPYVMVVGYASHRKPSGWPTGRPEVFKDVDTGNNRRFTKQQRVIYEGVVPKDAYVGFAAVMWEKDASSDNEVMKIATAITERINNWYSEDLSSFPKTIAKILSTAPAYLITAGIWTAGGDKDDWLGEAEVTLSYRELKDLAENHSHIPRRLVFGDNTKGKYWLRYHIEFGEGATKEFPVNFNEWDDLAVGNIDRTPPEEIVVVSNKDAAGDNGRFCIYDGNGRLIRCFDAPYSPGDRLAVGDTNGDGICEIIVASPQNGGIARMYDAAGSLVDRISIPFAKHDGVAVGDVNGDGRDEVLLARVSEQKIYVFSAAPQERKLDEFLMNWKFKGFGYAAKDRKHDVFLVGDVVGDSSAEIVMIENKNDTSSVIRVYNGKGREVTNPLTVGALGAAFRHYNGAALGDLYGDKKKELILAAADDDGSYSFTTVIADLATGKRVGTRHWPWYLKRSKMAAGAVFQPGKAQVVVANTSDKRVYVGR